MEDNGGAAKWKGEKEIKSGDTKRRRAINTVFVFFEQKA